MTNDPRPMESSIREKEMVDSSDTVKMRLLFSDHIVIFHNEETDCHFSLDMYCGPWWIGTKDTNHDLAFVSEAKTKLE